jgi:type IV pilus assembly protein PilY1
MYTLIRTRQGLGRWLAAVLAWTLMLGQFAQPVLAQTVPPALADVPIAAKVSAKPNIMFTLDDSGSMLFTYLPDYVVGNFCRSGNNITACAAIPNAASNFFYPPVLAADFNRLAYNPDVNYQPPLKYDGTPFTTTKTDAFGNQSYGAGTAQDDPWVSPQPGTMRNLTAKVPVVLYCNTDWPLTAGANFALNPDAGDSNGEYLAGSGAWCRINGTAYDANANGAPAVTNDYNYPYNSSTGATGTQYFFRNLSFKQLWCDLTSPKWPHAGTGTACVTTCSAGVTVTTPQTCNVTGTTSACCTGVGSPAGCPGASTYTPAGCNTSLLYCSPGLGSAPECIGGCACNQRVNGNAAKCSITGAGCNCTGVGCVPVNPNNPSCPDQVTGCTLGGTLTTTCKASTVACNSFTWDPVAGAPTTTTLLQDANGAGEVCRHNNQTYVIGGVAGPFKYSAGAAAYPGDVSPANAAAGQTGKFNQAATAAGCPTIGTTVNVPRHYYTISSVQFCNAVDGIANDVWKGFGTGACQTKNDFVNYKNVKYGTFTKISIINDGRTFAYTDQVTGAAMARSYAQETQNYANWYSYYRSRILATKTSTAIAFSFLDDTYRVGFHNLGTELPPYGATATAPVLVNVNDWILGVGKQRDLWYQALFAIAPTNGKTPTNSAMLRIGNLFETGGAGGLPNPDVNPLPAGATDPIQLSCQSNYHILFTDGTTNQLAQPNVVGERDDVVPVIGASIVDNPPDNVMPNIRALAGLAWPTVAGPGPYVAPTYPSPFREDPANKQINTLADIAMYYWIRDLRPGMKNDVPAPSAKGSTPTYAADLDPTKDIAWWQHLNFSAISFGAEGVLDASNISNTIKSVSAGTTKWPNMTPNVFAPTNPAGSTGASAVDDLWHATVNGRGKFVSAKSPLEVSYGLASILAGIQNQRKSRVAAAFGGQVLDATNNTIYESTIEPGWAGDVLRVTIDPKDGSEVATVWQAQPLLNALVKPSVPGDEPWFAKRKVVTRNDSTGTGIPFLFSKLSAAQLNSLSPDPTQQQKIIAYLRGGTTFGPGPTPTVIEGTGIGQFRDRSGFGYLGDITNAQALFVDVPNRPYKDINDPGYSTFVAAKAARLPKVYAAANDGMLHSFDAATGQEDFAFIPSALFRGVAGNVLTQDVSGIQALTYQDGGVPIYHHHFYVDSSPRAGDVDFGGGDWHTILVGGLGKGGNTYYALDITDSGAVDESAAAAKVLWEWRNPDNDDDAAHNHKLGTTPAYTYGRPVIVKTRAYGWTVLVTSGYNNKSGVGTLYMLNPKTGAVMNQLSTGTGSGANPSGFAQIHAFVKDESNQIAEQVYGGDLFGNLWRFDVSDPNPANWKVVLFAKLTDSGGVGQPITTAPQIEVDLNNGINRYVLIGTGRLLDTSDLTNPAVPQQQTAYAIRDGTLSTILVAGLPIQPRVTLDSQLYTALGTIVGGAPNGWYSDLPTSPSERIVEDVNADVNIFAFIGTQVPNDPCLIALPATLYARDYTTGRSLLQDSGGAQVASIAMASGAVGGTLVGRVDPVTGAQSLGWLVSTEVPGSKPIDIINPITGPGNRLSWRLLTGQ